MFNSTMYYVVNLIAIPLRYGAILLLVWFIIKFLPAVLQRVGLRESIDDKALMWLNTALIGFTLIFAIIQPFIAFLANHLPL